jgi:hypothetical protein
LDLNRRGRCQYEEQRWLELPPSATGSALDLNRRGRCQYEEQIWPELPPSASGSALDLNRRGRCQCEEQIWARTASFCFGFSFGYKKERQDVSMRSRYGPELPPFASDSALDLNRRGTMSVREAGMAKTASFYSRFNFLNIRGRMSVK